MKRLEHGFEFYKKEKKNRNADTCITISALLFCGISDESNKYLYFKMLKNRRELFKNQFLKDVGITEIRLNFFFILPCFREHYKNVIKL